MTEQIEQATDECETRIDREADEAINVIKATQKERKAVAKKYCKKAKKKQEAEMKKVKKIITIKIK